MSDNLYQIAVNAPIKGTLTYHSLPGTDLPLGSLVTVPLGKRKAEAVVIAAETGTPEFAVKNIIEHISDFPSLNESYLKWAQWLADYYMYPVGQVLNLAFPPLRSLKRKGTSQKSAVVRAEAEPTARPTLTQEQSHCIDHIPVDEGFKAHLVFGVTGSGKTEIYLRLFEKVLAKGQQCLLLVPEISLTPQLIRRVSSRFPEQVAVLHSHLTEREKTEQWWAMIKGERKILIGARSAIFCPLDNLGVIIVDEEHEGSYKQEEKLRYHARDAAVMRAKFLDIPILLGSATPSLESYQNAVSGKYVLHSLAERVENRPLPKIEVIDLRTKEKNQALATQPFWLSDQLLQQLTETLANKKQAALFLNRRGVANYTQCMSCGFVYECPNCAISLTLHGGHHLVCHYCNFAMKEKDVCPTCQSDNILPSGLGTEKVETDIQKLFPEARIARADRDEIFKREQLEDLILSIENREIDILIGTQMIAKGLDFPNLDFVGLVLADVGVHIPDFRSSERSFQLMTQMSGRAGRHSKTPGRVILQTFNTQQPAILYASQSDFTGFAQQELALRKTLGYPPFSKLAAVRFVASSYDQVQSLSDHWGQLAQKLKALRPQYASIEILGPAPAPMTKLRNKYRFHLLLKAPNQMLLKNFISELNTDQSKKFAGTKVQIDIDPVQMM